MTEERSAHVEAGMDRLARIDAEMRGRLEAQLAGEKEARLEIWAHYLAAQSQVDTLEKLLDRWESDNKALREALGLADQALRQGDDGIAARAIEAIETVMHP